MHRKKLPIGRYIKFSEESNALDYLEKAYHFIQKVDRNPNDWKWVIIALHGALYGFAVCACRGTDPHNVTFKSKNSEKLISFDEALQTCQDPKIMKMTTLSKHLELSSKQKESIDILKKTIRNNFEHFIPKTWYIEIHGFPQIAIDVLDVIRFLALEAHNYSHLSTYQTRQLKSYVYQSKKLLKNSKLYKEYLIAKSKG